MEKLKITEEIMAEIEKYKTMFLSNIKKIEGMENPHDKYLRLKELYSKAVAELDKLNNGDA